MMVSPLPEEKSCDLFLNGASTHDFSVEVLLHDGSSYPVKCASLISVAEDAGASDWIPPRKISSKGGSGTGIRIRASNPDAIFIV